ncbi:MAG: outer membrane protein assembly factor BamB family protein [Gaiellaceae bacterium]
MKKVLIALAGVVVLVAAGLVAYGLYRKHQGRDVRGSSSVEFVTTQAPKPKPPPKQGIVWPMYRFDPTRQAAPEGIPPTIRPPFHVRWYFRARALVEFPPAIAYGRLYFANGHGKLYAVDTKLHGAIWQHVTNRCTAATPEVADHTVFMSFLNKPPCNATRSGLTGLILALNADTGKVRWRVGTGPSESSPLVVGRTVYVGDWRGKVYALNTRNGHTRWTFQTGGAVKDGMAYAGGRLYFGSYDSHVYSLNARTGKLIWKASAQQRLGATGTFYSTPAVAYDRVYIGGTDGKVYSFGATTGKLRWSHGTGNYVYGSPAVWGQRVMVGSYDGTFYCFDAATGDVRWKFKANGTISGSAVVLNGLVYFSTFSNRTYALDARTGKPLWFFRRGKYAGVVTDRKWLYLVGHGRVFAMLPQGGR